MAIHSDFNTVKAIVHSHDDIDHILNELSNIGLARHNISVQKNFETVKKTTGETRPEKLFYTDYIVPKEFPVTHEERNWGYATVISISTALGVISMLLGFVSINSSMLDFAVNFIVGSILGFSLGYIIANFLKHIKNRQIKKQEKEGGYAFWLYLHNVKKTRLKQIKKILQLYDADLINLN
jgi:hypothetical protein